MWTEEETRVTCRNLTFTHGLRVWNKGILLSCWIVLLSLKRDSFLSPRHKIQPYFRKSKEDRCTSVTLIKSSVSEVCEPLLALSAVREISAIALDTCLDTADLCGPTPCALGRGWMDTRRALFPEADEFVQCRFWNKRTRGRDQLKENTHWGGTTGDLRVLLHSLQVALRIWPLLLVSFLLKSKGNVRLL